MGGDEVPRLGSFAAMMHRPHRPITHGLNACFVGVPSDLGSSNRSDPRPRPRQVRSESMLLRPYNLALHVTPFGSSEVSDIGNVAINPYNTIDTIDRIE